MREPAVFPMTDDAESCHRARDGVDRLGVWCWSIQAQERLKTGWHLPCPLVLTATRRWTDTVSLFSQADSSFRGSDASGDDEFGELPAPSSAFSCCDEEDLWRWMIGIWRKFSAVVGP